MAVLSCKFIMVCKDLLLFDVEFKSLLILNGGAGILIKDILMAGVLISRALISGG